MLMCVFVWGSLSVPLVQARTSTEKKEKPWVLSYYVGYQNRYLKPEDVDYSLMSHVAVGAVGVNADGTLDPHFSLEHGSADGSGKAMAKRVAQLGHGFGTKSLLWLGGPNDDEDLYQASTDANRAVFVKNIIALADELSFDGVDIDWEPITEKDRPVLLALVKDLRAARPNFIITIPINWVVADHTYELSSEWFATLSQYADKLFVMTYSMAGPWAGWSVWHSAALKGESTKTPSSVASSVTYYLNAGVPKEKLGFGIGLYAECWRGPARRPGTVLPATYTDKIASLTLRYAQKAFYDKKSAKWDSIAKVPYLSFSKPKGDEQCEFVSFEDARSIREKTAYLKKQKLGGVIVWNLGTGYFPDEPYARRFTLLKEIYKGARS